MKKSGVLAAALVLKLASAVMAADLETVAPAKTDAILLTHEKSHLSIPVAPPERAEKALEKAAPAVTGDVYLGLASKYLFRGNSLSPNDAFVIQGGIDLTYGAFTLSYWTNAQSRKTGYRDGNITESDLILDYAIPTVPFVEKLKLNVGTQYFALDAADDTNEFYLKAAYDTLLKPTLTAYWDNINATRAGLFYTAAVSHKLTIKQDLLALNLGGLVSYNQRNPSAAYTGDDSRSGVYNGWHNYELTASIDYTPVANFIITPSYQFSNAMSGKARDVGIGDQNVFSLKALYAF